MGFYLVTNSAKKADRAFWQSPEGKMRGMAFCRLRVVSTTQRSGHSLTENGGIGTEQKETMKRNLMESAVRVVAREGLEKTTTRLISLEAKLNEAYLYRCFENKEHLLAETFYNEDIRFAHHIQKTLPVMQMSGLTWEEKCFLLWNSCWNFIIKQPDDCRFYIRYYYSANFRKYAYERHINFFKPLIEKISFAFRRGVNVDMLVHQIFDTMLSFAERVLSGEVADTEETTKTMFKQIFGFVSINAVPELISGEAQ